MRVPADIDMDVFRQQPRTCTKCNVTKTVADFAITTCRGHRVVRAHCQACMLAYYASSNKRQHTPPRKSRTVFDSTRTPPHIVAIRNRFLAWRAKQS